MSTINENLLAAVRGAVIENNVHEAGQTHLSAQRRLLEEGEETWAVFIAGFFRDGLTHVTDTLDRDCPKKTVDEIAALIADCWDPDWDEILVNGDFVARSVAEAA